MSAFWDWLREIEPCEGSLVWCHVTDGWSFREIVKSGACHLQRCKFFKEPLFYLSYGRPAFRVPDEPLAKSGASPVVLLFDSSLLEQGARLFPFDSGAFFTHRYDYCMHRKADVHNYELPAEPEVARRHVGAFFGSNAKYLRNQARTPTQNLSGLYEVLSLVELLCRSNTEHADDRRAAIELQLSAGKASGRSRKQSPEIRVDLGKLKGLVYPDEIEDADWFKGFVARFPRSAVSYRAYWYDSCKRASEYQGVLEEKVMDFHRAAGVL
jgi:hypothetical protein